MGMLIRLPRIYNFLLFHAVILSFLDVLRSFYVNFISFLGLTYWHSAPSASCCFLLVFYIAGNQYQTESKCSKTFCGFFLDQKTPVGPRKYIGGSEGSTTHQGTPRGPGAPRWVVPTSMASRTASFLYKYPNIPKTLGESTKHNSSRCKSQNHEIQSRHHHGGVHHPHWCLSDDARVVHHRPTGP